MKRTKSHGIQRRHIRRYSSGLSLVNPSVKRKKTHATIYVGIKGVRRNPPGSRIKPQATRYIGSRRKNYGGLFGPSKVKTPVGKLESYSDAPAKKEYLGKFEVYNREVGQDVQSVEQAVKKGDIDGAVRGWDNLADSAEKRASEAAAAKDKVEKETAEFLKKYNEAVKANKKWAPGEKQKLEDNYKFMQKFAQGFEKFNELEKSNYNKALENRDLVQKVTLESDIQTAAEQRAALLKNISDFKKLEEARRRAYVESRSMFKKMNFNFPKTFGRFDLGGFGW